MKFEVVNDRGRTIMSCTTASCVPDDEQLSSMAKAGYKFKIDGKTVNIKKVKEIRK